MSGCELPHACPRGQPVRRRGVAPAAQGEIGSSLKKRRPGGGPIAAPRGGGGAEIGAVDGDGVWGGRATWREGN